jgi:hypothetical protein
MSNLKIKNTANDSVQMLLDTSVIMECNVNEFVAKTVTSISQLATASTTGAVNVLNYHSDLEGGGGVFYWDATGNATEHNGGTVISPLATFPTDWNNQTQLTTWFDGSGLVGTGVWRRQYDGAVNVKWFGAKGDGVGDDTVATQNSIDNSEVITGDGDTKLSGNISISSGERAINWLKGTLTSLVNNTSLFAITAATKIRMSGVNVTRATTASTDTSHLIEMHDLNDVVISDATLSNIAGTGSALIAYTSNPLVPVKDITYRDLIINGAIGDSLNTNGALIADASRGIMHNLRVDGIREFAVEYKNATRDSLISNVIVTNSKTGIGYGQTTAGSDDVSYTAITNGVLHGCDLGIVLGDSHYTTISNIVINSEDAPTTAGTVPTGVRLFGVSDSNLITNVLLAGVNMSEPIRYGSTCTNNMVSASLQTPAAKYVILEAGASRNYTNIDMPYSDTSSIFSKIDNVSGNPLSGPTSNPIHCHATGEYYGILGNYWHFKYSDSGVAPATYHKMVLENTGSTFFGIMHNGVGEAGFSVKRAAGDSKLSLSQAGDYWRLSTPSYGIRFYSSTIRAESDNVMSLGSATNRYATVYAGTGTINTSDAREKTFLEINEAEALIAKDLKQLMKKFKFNDAIEAKGDNARIHYGTSAQEVIATFEKHGLNAMEYAMVCYDKWDEQPEELDEEGNVVVEYKPAGDRYGIRYEELLCFIISAM